jgi:hypothetical protein
LLAGLDGEALALRQRAVDVDRQAVEDDGAAGLEGDVLHDAGVEVGDHGLGDADGAHDLDLVLVTGEQRGVGDAPAVDPVLGVGQAGDAVVERAGDEEAVAAARLFPGQATVDGEREVLQGAGELAARHAVEAHAAGFVEEGGLAAALAAEDIAAAAVGPVGDRQQLRAQPADLVGQAAPLGVGVAGVAGRHQGLAHLLQDLAGVADRRLGQVHAVAAGGQRALVGLHLADGGQRALDARGTGRVVAGAGHLLAGGELDLRRLQLLLALLQRGNRQVELVGGGDTHQRIAPINSSKVDCATCSRRALAW